MWFRKLDTCSAGEWMHRDARKERAWQRMLKHRGMPISRNVHKNVTMLMRMQVMCMIVQNEHKSGCPFVVKSLRRNFSFNFWYTSHRLLIESEAYPFEHVVTSLGGGPAAAIESPSPNRAFLPALRCTFLSTPQLSAFDITLNVCC